MRVLSGDHVRPPRLELALRDLHRPRRRDALGIT